MNSITAVVVIARPTKTKATPAPTPPEPTPIWPNTIDLVINHNQVGEPVLFAERYNIPSGYIPTATYQVDQVGGDPLVDEYALNNDGIYMGTQKFVVRTPTGVTTVFTKLQSEPIMVDGTLTQDEK